MSRLIVVGLYSLLLSSLAQVVIVLQLYASRRVDATIEASLILALASSLLSLIFLFLHSLLALCYRQAVPGNGLRTRFTSVCGFLPRILILLWMVAAAVGLIVAARQPKCMLGQAKQNFWQIGISCHLHRTIVGMAVVAFISICAIFCCMEICGRPYQASLLGILKSDQHDSSHLKTSISSFGWHSAPSSDSLNREKIFLHRPMDLESLPSERALWFQRRNSLSSLSAIYPPTVRYASARPPSAAAPFQLNRNLSSFAVQMPHAPSYRSTRQSSMAIPAPLLLSNFYSALPPGRAGSTVSSVSRSSSSTSSQKSPLSTMRRASEPEVPIIPARFLDAHTKPPLPRSPTLPCCWSPSLTHAPLSADPAIRTLSFGSKVPDESPITAVAFGQQMSSVDTLRHIEDSPDLNLSPPKRPDLPVRARGHSIPSSIDGAGFSTANSPVRSSQCLANPCMSAVPKSSTASSTQIPRTSSPLTLDQDGDQSIKRCQFPQYPSPAKGKGPVSSRLSTDSTAHVVFEAQQVRQRWEMARMKEASAYGMGGWGHTPKKTTDDS